MIWSCYFKFNYYSSLIKAIRKDLLEFNKSKETNFINFINSKPKGYITRFPSVDESTRKLMIITLTEFLEDYKYVRIVETRDKLKKDEVYHINENTFIVNGTVNIKRSKTEGICFDIDPSTIQRIKSRIVIRYKLPPTHTLRKFFEENFKLYNIAYNIEHFEIFKKIKNLKLRLRETNDLTRSDIAECIIDLNNTIRTVFNSDYYLYDFFNSITLFDKDNKRFNLVYNNNTVTLIRNYI